LSLVIFLTGERSAFLSVLIFLILCLLVCKNNRPLFFKTIIVLSFSVFLIFQNFKPLNDRYNFSIVINDYSLNKNKKDVYEKVENYTGNNQASLINRVKLKYTMLADSVWFAHYRAAILIFKNNLFIGSGFRTYRFECPRLEKINNNGIICTNHPHNIYLELASDLGLVGLFIFIIFIIKIIKDYILKKFYKKFTINILFFGFLSFLFPFKPHGSLFSTNYSFIFWFLLTFIIIEFFYSNENKNINS
jgi:O-antigen ligase